MLLASLMLQASLLLLTSPLLPPFFLVLQHAVARLQMLSLNSSLMLAAWSQCAADIQTAKLYTYTAYREHFKSSNIWTVATSALAVRPIEYNTFSKTYLGVQ
jgi:hypothetical protein